MTTTETPSVDSIRSGIEKIGYKCQSFRDAGMFLVRAMKDNKVAVSVTAHLEISAWLSLAKAVGRLEDPNRDSMRLETQEQVYAYFDAMGYNSNRGHFR